MSLDSEQLAVVEMPIDANTLVQAGPGRGKTHVLVSRIAHLVDTGQCAPGELLVLSFSRAARDELKRRIGLLNEQSMASAVTIRTLDSFASVILQMASGETTGSYDERIKRAIRDLEDDPDACGVTQFRHVLVDEAQDIIGPRADMMLMLLNQMPHAGFTFFADSAQAIYDFGLIDDSALTMSREMLNVFECRTQPTDCRVTHLVNYYRSSDPELVELCTDPWATLIDEDYDVAKMKLDALLTKVSRGGSIEKLLWPTQSKGQSRAVIFPNNGQVLLAASRSIRAGENIAIARGERDWAHPAWVGRLLFGRPQSTEISAELLNDELSDRLPDGVTAQEVHQALRMACSTGRSNPKVRDVIVSLNRGQQFQKLPKAESAVQPIIFSTIHRSKGSEYDEVAYMDYIPWPGDKEPTLGYNQRMRFVGLSRAKVRNFKLSVSNEVMLAKSKSSERWAECTFIGGGKRGIKGFEVGLQGDVDPVSFVRFPTIQQAAHAQEKLNQLCKRGEVVDLVLGLPKGDSSLPIYSIVQCATGEKIGEMSIQFSRDIISTRNSIQAWGRDNPLPLRLEGCWVRGIYTVSPSDCESMEGLPVELSSGLLWSYVEVEGMAKVVWS